MSERINNGSPQSSVDQSFKTRLAYLEERVGDATSDELTALLIERCKREHLEEHKMGFYRLMALVAGGFVRLGYNPHKPDLAGSLPFVGTLPTEAVEISYSGLTYNLEERTARTKYAKTPKHLTPTEGTIMGLLIASPERVIPYGEILRCMGVNCNGIYEREILKVHVCHLRGALRRLYEKGRKDEFDYPIPVVLRGIGYEFTNGVDWRRGAPNTRLLGTMTAQPVISTPQS